MCLYQQGHPLLAQSHDVWTDAIHAASSVHAFVNGLCLLWHSDADRAGTAGLTKPAQVHCWKMISEDMQRNCSIALRGEEAIEPAQNSACDGTERRRSSIQLPSLIMNTSLLWPKGCDVGLSVYCRTVRVAKTSDLFQPNQGE